MKKPAALFILGTLLAVGAPWSAAVNRGEDKTADSRERRLSLGLGMSLGAFNSCPAFNLSAVFPVTSRLSAEAEFAYHFNPAEDEPNPPPDYHRSSAALGLSLSGLFALREPGGPVTPYIGLGAGAFFLSILTDRPPAEREIQSRRRLAAVLLGGILVPFGTRAGLCLEARQHVLSGGDGLVLRLSAAVFAAF
ncbi:MAG: hypothetical protein JW747_04305 [Candidatus Aminicenantes bacterium]|nr:hypothetical protein [Candidatus Aminicenantes bacterium]